MTQYAQLVIPRLNRGIQNNRHRHWAPRSRRGATEQALRVIQRLDREVAAYGGQG